MSTSNMFSIYSPLAVPLGPPLRSFRGLISIDPALHSRNGIFFACFLHFSHPPRFSNGNTTVLHLVAVDEGFSGPRPSALPCLTFAIEIGEGNIEPVDMRRDHGTEEEEAIEEAVCFRTTDKAHCERGNCGGTAVSVVFEARE